MDVADFPLPIAHIVNIGTCSVFVLFSYFNLFLFVFFGYENVEIVSMIVGQFQTKQSNVALFSCHCTLS